MSLDGMTFRATANSSHGTLNTETRMTFSERDGSITAVYSGGTIRTGSVVARGTGPSTLEMLYHCITVEGELKVGRASATFTGDDSHMQLDWQWLTGDRAVGVSEWVHER